VDYGMEVWPVLRDEQAAPLHVPPDKRRGAKHSVVFQVLKEYGESSFQIRSMRPK